MRQNPLTTKLHQALSDELRSYFRPSSANDGSDTGALSNGRMPIRLMQQMELDLRISDAAKAQRVHDGSFLA